MSGIRFSCVTVLDFIVWTSSLRPDHSEILLIVTRQSNHLSKLSGLTEARVSTLSGMCRMSIVAIEPFAKDVVRSFSSLWALGSAAETVLRAQAGLTIKTMQLKIAM